MSRIKLFRMLPMMLRKPSCIAVLCCISGLTAIIIWTQILMAPDYNIFASLNSPHIVERVIKTEKRAVPYAHNRLTCFPTIGKITTSNVVWQVAKSKESSIYIFGAYFDQRTSVQRDYKSFAVIRLFAIATSQIAKSVYCQIRAENDTLLEITEASSENTGRGLAVNRTLYHERMLTCPVSQQHAMWISITFSMCEQATNHLEIQRNKQNVQQIQIGVCVAVSYGRISPVALAEWIEFHRLLGVEEFNFYDSLLNSKSRGALQVYEKLGVVKLRKSAPPILNWSKWCQKLAVIPALQDCMYRNMYRYKYLLIMDVDEFLIPRKHSTLTDMLNSFPSITSQKNDSNSYLASSYLFRNAYFFLDFNVSTFDRHQLLVTKKYTKRAPTSKLGYAAKSVINPRLCVAVQNHYCMTRTSDAVDSFTWPVPEDTAIVHHYKMCHLSREICADMMKEGLTDNIASSFHNQVHDRIQKILPSFVNL